MSSRYRAFVLLLGVVAVFLPGRSMAAPAGKAVAVIQQATVDASGQLRMLSVGAPVAMGEVVQTGPNGESQLLFNDGTRIVVGPSSRLMIESVLFNSSGAASRFAINALGGTFRFISGNSPKAVYAIRTPTATMSVRGTTFDFSVKN